MLIILRVGMTPRELRFAMSLGAPVAKKNAVLHSLDEWHYVVLRLTAWYALVEKREHIYDKWPPQRAFCRMVNLSHG